MPDAGRLLQNIHVVNHHTRTHTHIEPTSHTLSTTCVIHALGTHYTLNSYATAMHAYRVSLMCSEGHRPHLQATDGKGTGVVPLSHAARDMVQHCKLSPLGFVKNIRFIYVHIIIRKIGQKHCTCKRPCVSLVEIPYDSTCIDGI